MARSSTLGVSKVLHALMSEFLLALTTPSESDIQDLHFCLSTSSRAFGFAISLYKTGDVAVSASYCPVDTVDQ